MDKYVVYVNGDSTGKEFPYTVDGFLHALWEASVIQTKSFRRDLVHVVNPNQVDEDRPYGLTEIERDVAMEMGYSAHS
jgi:hypothetical protein